MHFYYESCGNFYWKKITVFITPTQVNVDNGLGAVMSYKVHITYFLFKTKLPFRGISLS